MLSSFDPFSAHRSDTKLPRHLILLGSEVQVFVSPSHLTKRGSGYSFDWQPTDSHAPHDGTGFPETGSPYSLKHL